MDVIIAGAGGSGLKVLEILETQSDLKLIGFMDDDKNLWDTEFFGYRVFKKLPEKATGAICPIGDPKNRLRMIDRLRKYNIKFPNAIHPSAQISIRANVGIGNVFSQNVVVQPGVQIGDFNTFNISAILGPLSEVHNFCTINMLAVIASKAKIGDYCYIGMGAKIMQRIALARGTIVGANAFVRENTKPWSTMVGLPAKMIKQEKEPDSEHLRNNQAL